jgi:hypothetical protein
MFFSIYAFAWHMNHTGIIFFLVTSLKRLDSTKRIRKEMWRKRSDFLGIEGSNDDSYLEPGTCMAIIITLFSTAHVCIFCLLTIQMKMGLICKPYASEFLLKKCRNEPQNSTFVYHPHQGIAASECCVKRVSHMKSYICWNVALCSPVRVSTNILPPSSGSVNEPSMKPA